MTTFNGDRVKMRVRHAVRNLPEGTDPKVVFEAVCGAIRSVFDNEGTPTFAAGILLMDAELPYGDSVVKYAYNRLQQHEKNAFGKLLSFFTLHLLPKVDEARIRFGLTCVKKDMISPEVRNMLCSTEDPSKRAIFKAFFEG